MGARVQPRLKISNQQRALPRRPPPFTFASISVIEVIGPSLTLAERALLSMLVAQLSGSPSEPSELDRSSQLDSDPLDVVVHDMMCACASCAGSNASKRLSALLGVWGHERAGWRGLCGLCGLCGFCWLVDGLVGRSFACNPHSGR